MATIIEVAPAPWRLQLQPASFNGVPFHVEQQARSRGRRVVLHEYPKRDTPYAEDMGMHAIRYQITGYLVGPDYHLDKRDLMEALDNSTGGVLIDPYIGEPFMCICERYNVTETRQRGGYCTFEMAFVEAGKSGNTITQTNTQSVLQSKSTAAGSDQATVLNGAAALGQGGIGSA